MTGRVVARKLSILLPLIVLFFGLPSIGLAWEACGDGSYAGGDQAFGMYCPSGSQVIANEPTYFYNKCHGDWDMEGKAYTFFSGDAVFTYSAPNITGNEPIFHSGTQNYYEIPGIWPNNLTGMAVSGCGGAYGSWCSGVWEYNGVLESSACYCWSNESPAPSLPECESYSYSSWSSCSSGQQTRSVVSSVPSECSGGVQPSLTQACLDETATSSISSEWNNYNSSQSWVDLTGTCSPSDTNTLVYVYQSNTTDLPSDHYNSVGIQMGISSSLFQTYAEPCSSEGTWHRIVFLGTGDNYFTTYTRTQNYSTSWTAKNPSNTVKVLYGSPFDYHITWPSGSDSLIGQYPLRTLDKKSFYDTGQEFSFIGYFDNGSLLSEQSSFRVDEVSSTGSVITSEIYSGSIAESYKTACENYPRGCLYALKIPYSAISAGNGIRYFKILFSNDNNWSVIFDVQYLALTLTDNDSDSDIDWGLPIDDNWSTTTQPYIPDEDLINVSLDFLFLKYSKSNICGQKPAEITGILSAVKAIPYAICGFGYDLLFPSKAALNYFFTLDGVLKDSFPWSIPFVVFDSLDEKLDSASSSYNDYSIPLKFLIAGEEVTVDVTGYFHDTLTVVGSTQLGWVFNGITLRVFLGNLLAVVVLSLIFILMFSFPDRLE